MAARRAWSFTALAVLAVLLSACGTKQPAPAPKPSPTVAIPPKPRAVSTEDYFKMESSHSLMVVRAAELAMTRSASGKVLEIASRLKADHTGIAAQLSMAGRRLNLLPPATPLMLDQVLLEGLARAPDFNTEYLRLMRRAAEACSHSHADYAEHGDSPTLRPVARFAAGICSDEIQLIP